MHYNFNWVTNGDFEFRTGVLALPGLPRLSEMSGIRQKSRNVWKKSGKSLELVYLSGKSLEFEENCPELI